MGNRCVILNKERTKAIYQHWNGGRDSIEPLLQIAKEEYELIKMAFILSLLMQFWKYLKRFLAESF